MSDRDSFARPQPDRPTRSPEDRRKVNLGPPDGNERRQFIDMDRRTENNVQYLTFRLDRQLLGLPLEEVQEVILSQRVTPIPLAPECVSGFLNLRGNVITAIDLRARLALPPKALEQGESMNVVVRSQAELFSLIVDEIGDVLTVAKAKFGGVPTTLDPVWQSCSKGVCNLQKELLVVIDVSKLLMI